MNFFKLINKNPVWFLFLFFFLVLFIKCVAFIYIAAFDSSGWDDWAEPLLIYQILMYIGVCGMISSFVFILRWRWLIVIGSVFLDVWLMGNLIYWRSYHDMLSVYSLEAAGNMSGYWSSIFVFLEWKDALFLLLTILLAAVIIYLPKTRCKLWTNIIYFLVCFFLSTLCVYPHAKSMKRITGFSHPLNSKYATDNWFPNIYYCEQYTPITYFLLHLRVLVSISNEIKPLINIEDIEPFLSKNDDMDHRENYNLLIVLFESMETWVVHSEINNQPIMPNLNKLLSSQHCLFADKVTDQTLYGKSMDGQQILNTGLLPVYRGVTTNRYWSNFYFSITNALQNYTKNSYIEHDGTCWNEFQTAMSYGYDTVAINMESDLFISKDVIKNMPKKPYVIQVVTGGSHSPFTNFNDSSLFVTPTDMPKDMANYIKSVNYTDHALGLLFDNISLDSTIVIVTGDHTIFYDDKREMFQQYCNKNNIDIPVEKAFVPLIIHSPDIKERALVADTVYQMDIYPTLLPLLHREDYIWQGFGINLLDKGAKRKITPDEALRLSDAIIRNDFFRTISDYIAPDNKTITIFESNQ